jgi:N-acetyl-gamma-glutamyl-phosphate reductase
MRILAELMTSSFTAGIVGASGYAGGELIRFIDGHPSMELVFLGAHSKAGRRLGEVHPHLDGGERVLERFRPDALAGVDVVFFALPHGASADPAMELAPRGSKIVDLGSDFRMDTAARYRDAYQVDHPYPEQLGTWAYGIPELFADDIVGADLVAAPGCYPTSAVLGLAPLIRAGLVEPTGIVADAMSGVSGAGRSVSEGLMFGSIDESVKAYKVLQHRHRPEMERALDVSSETPTSVLFVPHLVPMQRGILSTMYANAVNGTSQADLETALDVAYEGSRFVRRIDEPPQTRWVVGSNNALLSVHLDDRTGTAVILSAIDNLVKGAAGQAVQCANLMLGIDEHAGLPTQGWMP